MTKTPATPESAVELLQFVELTAVRTYEISGRRTEPAADDDEDAEPEVLVRAASDEIEVRMKLEVASRGAEYVADVAVVYGLSRPVNLHTRVLAEFIERAAVMAVYPFVREAVFTTASRMGTKAPLLGLMHAGHFSVGDLGGDDFMPSRADATVSALSRELDVPQAELVALLADLGVSAASGRSKVPGEASAQLRLAAHRRAREIAAG